MTIEDTNKIDIIRVQENSITLIAVSGWQWGGEDENDHFYYIQEKINSYLAYAESGQMLEEYPGSSNKNLIIKLKFANPPDVTGEKFLQQCEETLRDAGYMFFYDAGAIEE